MIVGFTGHQQLPVEALSFIRKRIQQELDARSAAIGITSLAAGADQIFAKELLNYGGNLQVIIPSARYESTFRDADDLSAFHHLIAHASSVEILPFNAPSQEAYLKAGQRIVDLSNLLIAVWDGRPAQGLGGTADIVSYAAETGHCVSVIWPTGTVRETRHNG